MDVNEFALLILEQRRAWLAERYSEELASWETVKVIPGPKYTKVDVGPEHNMSGKFMVENATGIIYGIKGYGKVHKGHMYGTLDTAGQWYWGDYTPARVTGSRPHSIIGICTLAPNRPRADVGICTACAEEGLFDGIPSPTESPRG